jgi:hypothetical protein
LSRFGTQKIVKIIQNVRHLNISLVKNNKNPHAFSKIRSECTLCIVASWKFTVKVSSFTTFIHFKMQIVTFVSGAMLRRGSLDPGNRRMSLGGGSAHRSNSSDCSLLDPAHAAILFRDSRGVSLHKKVVYFNEII